MYFYCYVNVFLYVYVSYVSLSRQLALFGYPD
jgi:hypothetical protein